MRRDVEMHTKGTSATVRRAGIAAGLGVAAIVAIVSALAGGAPMSGLAGDAPHSPAERVSAPRLLSETGLYMAGGGVDPRNAPFVPQYPLWTDGAEKSRWIRLPKCSKVDITDIDACRFPAGTKVWKEFAWGGRKVETRFLWTPDGETWVFAAYAWRPDQSDAELVPESGAPGAFEIAPGRWHSIPGREDCLACHGSSPAPLLGFSALQLSDDRDPLAPHAEPPIAGGVTLRSLVAEDRFEPERPDLVRIPPRIRESDPVARAAIGYLSANCGGCHNERGALVRLGFSLLHEVEEVAGLPEPALATTLEAPCRFDLPGAPLGASRLLVAGAPERSVILHRMRSRSSSSQMPPLGTTIRDEVAIDLLERWIAGLGGEETGGEVSRATE